MTQEPVLLQQRLISGKGVLKIPPDTKKVRYYTLYSDVNRKPKNEYLNFNWNPPRSRYATLNFFRNGYFQFQYALEYPRQSWDFIADVTSQELIAVKCAYIGVLTSIANLGAALATPPVAVADKIKDYEYLNLLFDEIRVVCYADTSVELKLYVTKNDTCEPDKDIPKKPPPPPSPLPLKPPGTPDPNISKPYEPTTSDPLLGDNGNTDPSPIDRAVIPPPPPPPPPDGTYVRWGAHTSISIGNTFASAGGSTRLPISDYQVPNGSYDYAGNHVEWNITFSTGEGLRGGSQVGTINPVDKPTLYIWLLDNPTTPYMVIPPP